MSVQVRRRREAASFLSTYVGAQGELLVDTSNNRVQVHDGATPGGWPAAAVGDLGGRNAVINGSFAVNQRAYASGTALAAGAYAHDRWKAGSGGCTYTFTQAVPDTSVTITAGTLVQAVDAGSVYASAMWLTWTGTATARVWQGSATGAFAAGTATRVGGIGVNALLVSGLAIGTIAAIEFSTGTLGLVQLEAALPNAGPTRFERRHLGLELALCQRFYQVIGGSLSNELFLVAVFYGNNVGAGILPLKVTMRAAPTVSFGPASSFTMGGGTNFTPTALALYTATPAAIGFGITISGSTTAGYAAYLQANATSATIACSAEI